MKYWYKNENVAVITKKDRKELLDDFDNTNTIGQDPITHVFGGSCLRKAYYARKKTGCNDKPLQAQREIILEFDNGLMLGVCNQKEDQYVCDLYYDCGEGECVRANVQAHQTAEGAAPKHGEAAESQRTLAQSAGGSSGAAPCSGLVPLREAEPSGCFELDSVDEDIRRYYTENRDTQYIAGVPIKIQLARLLRKLLDGRERDYRENGSNNSEQSQYDIEPEKLRGKPGSCPLMSIYGLTKVSGNNGSQSALDLFMDVASRLRVLAESKNDFSNRHVDISTGIRFFHDELNRWLNPNSQEQSPPANSAGQN